MQTRHQWCARSAWLCALLALCSLSCNTRKVVEVDDAGSDGGVSGLSQALVNDRDSDGVVDASDNCPDVANANQKNSNNAGPGDACELALVLNQGLLSRYALYGSHKQLLILPLPVLFVSQPDLLRLTAKAPSNALAALNLLGPNELGVASPGQILPSQLGAISGSEVLSIGLGQADPLRNALARSVWLRVQGTANVSLTFFHGSSAVGTATGTSQSTAGIKRFDASAPFDRVEIRATNGSFSIRGQGPAVMFAIGRAQPTCPAGYTRVGTSCVDIDECSGIDRVCDPLTTCVNTPGSFTCGACPSGYRGTGATGCSDIDECEEETDTCSDLTICSNTAGSYTCGACPEGHAGDGRTCTDVNECTAGTDTCDPLVTCTNTQGGYTCGTCPAGYEGGGSTGCTDIDECTGPNHACDALTTCSNTPGSFTCGACPGGYSGDGVAGCVDVDECASGLHNCSPIVTCGNTPGGFQCGDCPAGYRGDGRTCTDVNECSEHTDLCSALVTCTNTQGGYTCGACPAGYTGDGQTCTDINECEAHPCDARTTCTNNEGAYACSACPAGYVGNGYAGCVDVDECMQELDDCSPLVACANTDGSFQCGDCPAGYQGDGRTCTDINECQQNTDECSNLVTCTNTVGGHTCGACPTGYAGNGYTCTDIDECANVPCDALTTCTNSDGSYLCGACPPGYTGDGYTSCLDIDECAVENGQCPDTHRCVNTVGSRSCETCNPSQIGVSTQCGVGACASSGVTSCSYGEVVNSCTPGTALESDASCNNIDDDCNGAVDEDFIALATSCGAGACAASGVLSCVNGTTLNSCAPGAPAASDATCNDVDDDCDGAADQEYATSSTSCGVGACAATGSLSCVGGAVSDSCHAGTPASSDATCNGVDDDCDGSVDEDFADSATTCGLGACVASGTTSCQNGVVVDTCVAGTGETNDATCNGVDDDCDGVKDDSYVPISIPCIVDGCAGTASTSCADGAVVATCVALPACVREDDCTDAVDDDGDGKTDCADPDCGSHASCFEDCDNDADDDGDGDSDCFDASCASIAPCIAEICGNTLDDDGDLRPDCHDSDCASDPLCPQVPPSLSEVALPIPPVPEPTILDRFGFLIEGVAPLQQGFIATIDAERAAIVSVHVMDRSGSPLASVKAEVYDHPEYGSALTDAGGDVTLLVPGATDLTLALTGSGLLPSWRTVTLGWGRRVEVPPVTMISLDPQATSVDLNGAAPAQVVRASINADERGSRQATALIPAGLTAEVLLPNGQYAALPTASIRLTEYTVGDNGPETMPASLPRNTGYTYAFEATADEALAVGAKKIIFNRDVPIYVDNFLNVPDGLGVPLGYFDPSCACWVPEGDARVMRIVGSSQGLAALDVTGDGVADPLEVLSILGISHDELTQLASLYPVGKSLWRMPIRHFTPWDCNLNQAPPDDCEYPEDEEDEDSEDPDKCEESGSAIGCSSRSLGESIRLAGTDYSLQYTTRTLHPSQAEFAITGASVPQSVRRVTVTTTIGDRTETATFSPLPNQTHVIEWNGVDLLGRYLSGSEKARISVCYWYAPVLYPSRAEARNAFAAVAQRFFQENGVPFVAPAPPLGGEIPLCQEFTRVLQADAGNRIRNDPSAASAWQLDAAARSDTAGGALSWGRLFATTGGEPVPTRLPVSFFNGYESLTAYGDIAGVLGDGTTILFDYSRGEGDYYDYSTSRLVSASPGQSVRIADPDGFDDFDVEVCLRSLSHSEDCSEQTTQLLGSIFHVAFSPDGARMFAYFGKHRSIFVFRVERRIDAYGVVRLAMVDGLPLVGGVGASGIPRMNGSQGNEILDTTQVSIALKDLRRSHETLFEATDDGALYVGAPTRLVNGVYDDRFEKALWRIRPNRMAERIAFPPIEATSDQSGFGNSTRGPDGSLFARTGKLGEESWHWIHADGSYDLVYKTDPRCTFATGVTCEIRSDAHYDPVRDRLLTTRVTQGTRDTVSIVALDFRSLVGLANPRREDTLDSEVVMRFVVDPSYDLPWNIALAKGTYIGTLPNPPTWFVLGDGSIRTISSGSVRTAGFAGIIDLKLKPSSDGTDLLDITRSGIVRFAKDSLSNRILRLYEYDENSRIGAVVTPAGARTTLERNPSGMISAIVASGGQRTELAYDSLNRLISVRSPLGGEHRMTYHGETQLLATFTRPGGSESRFVFDGKGKLLSDQDGSGAVQTLAEQATSNGSVVTHADADGVVTRYHNGAQEDASTLRVARTQTLFDEVVEQKLLSQTQTRSADGTVITSWNGEDPVIGGQAPYVTRQEIRTPTGRVLSSSVERRAERSTITGDVMRRVESTRLNVFSNDIWTDTRDFPARTRTIVSPMGRTTTLTYDALGRTISASYPGRLPLTFTYTGSKLVSAAQGVRGTAYEYDANGHMARATDANGESTLTHFDSEGRLLELRRNDGNGVSLAYDASSNLSSYSATVDDAHSYTYDQRSLLDSYMEDGEDPVVQWDYSPAKRLRRMKLAGGRAVTVASDALGRMASLSTSTSTSTFSYHPNTGARIAALGSEGTTVSFTADGALPLGEAWSSSTGAGPTGAVGVVYDTALRPATRTVNSKNVVTYGYDRDGLVTSAEAISGTGTTLGTLALTRAPATGMITRAAFGSLATSFTHSGYGELNTQTTTYGSTQLYSITNVQRDLKGRLLSLDERVQGVLRKKSYEYDAAGQLWRSRVDGALVAQYSYDERGNRTRRESGGTDELGAYAVSSNQGSSYGTFFYAFDSGGALALRQDAASGVNVAYSYNELGVLRSVQNVTTGMRVDYEIDPIGRRVGKKVNGTVLKRWLLDSSSRPVAELNSANQVTAWFIYQDQTNAPSLIVKGATVYGVVKDERGSVRLVVTASTGAVVQRMDYDEFGRVLNDTSPGFQPFGFAGGLYDTDTGLVRFGARDYDPYAGRWTARDPLLLGGGQSNLYAYASNDPVNFVDPNGLWLVPAAGAIVGAGFNMYDTWNAGGSAGDIALAGLVGAATGAASSFGAGAFSLANGATFGVINKIFMDRIKPGTACPDENDTMGMLLAGASGLVGNGLGNAIAARANVKLLSGLAGTTHFLDATADLSLGASLADAATRGETLAIYNATANLANNSWDAVGNFLGNGASGLATTLGSGLAQQY